MIYGTGIDIVDTERIQRCADRYGDSFYERLFTPDEIARFTGLKKSPYTHIHIAGRFAAKEAFYKATGGYEHFRWKDIEVRAGKNKAPGLCLHGKAKAYVKQLGITGIFLSISHEKKYAVAQVILEKSSNPA